MMKRSLLALVACVLLAAQMGAQGPTLVQQVPARLDAAAQIASTVTSAATLTLTPNAGETVYVYEMDVQNCTDGTGATPTTVTNITTTNLTGSPIWTMGSNTGTGPAIGIGQCAQSFSVYYPGGLKATALGTPVTFVTPTYVAQQTIRLNVAWRSGPNQ